MKKDNHIIRLWLMTMLVLIAGSVKAQINLESQLMNATVTWYNDAAATTAITTGTPGVNVYLKIEPATGYWTSAGDLNGKVEKIAGLSGADARRRVPGISQTADVTAVSGQTYAANGAGVYQVTLPALADGQTAEQIEKYVLTGTVNECTAISDATVTNDHATYNGSSVTAAISFNGAVRTKGTDYTVTTGNDARKDYGQESFTITGTGKFKGTANLTLNIDKKEVSLDWGTTNSWVFDTNSHEPAATVGNLVSGDVCTVSTYDLTAASGSSLTGSKAVNAGSYTITATALSNSNYKLPATGTSKDFTITEKDVNVDQTATGTGKPSIDLGGVPTGGFTYDGQPHVPTSITVKDENGNTIPEGEYTVSYKDSQGNPVNAPTNAGTYTVVVNDNTGGNYTVTGETTFTVKQATLAITAKGQTVTFGTDIATGTDQVTVSGLQGSDALSEIKLTQSTKDVSTNGTITPSQAVIKNGTTDVTTNYSITFNDGQLTITSKGVNADGSPTATGTIELSQESFTYDKQPHKPTVTVKDASGNVIPAEQYNVIYKDSKGQPVTDPTEADTYTVVITDKTGTGFDNYTVTGETTFTINAAAATLAFANVTKTFGDAAFTVTPTTDDSKGAITFTSSKTSVITVSGNQLSIVGAGEAIITASQAANGSYNATSTTFTVTVKPKTLTITADAKTKIIGDEDPILTYTSKGLVGTDKISGTLTRDEGEDPGTYAIRQGSLSAGNNYSISYTGANLTIKPEVISITAKNDWFTFSNNRDVTLPDGLTVNTCLLDPTGTKAMYYVVSDDQLTVNGQRVLKGGNGVLLHGKAGTTYKFTVIGTTKVSGNAKSYGATQLIPVIEETHFEKGQIFVLSSNKFVPILDTNTKVPARRAVLWLASGTTAARELTLVDSGTTGITTANSTDATDAWYTLDGRKLDEKPTKKGLYILNGRKVVIR